AHATRKTRHGPGPEGCRCRSDRLADRRPSFVDATLHRGRGFHHRRYRARCLCEAVARRRRHHAPEATASRPLAQAGPGRPARLCDVCREADVIAHDRMLRGCSLLFPEDGRPRPGGLPIEVIVVAGPRVDAGIANTTFETPGTPVLKFLSCRLV